MIHMIRMIIVIDDDMDIRDGLYAWLSQEYRVQCFAAAEDFLANKTAIRECDCLLLDLRMPGMNGAALQEALTKSGFAAPIIFMSGDARQTDIISAWRAGAFDFILKPISPNDISAALCKVFSAVEHDDSKPLQTSLPISRREAQVLLLLGKGLQQQEIADQLGLSLRTVKMYRAFLKNKLNLKTLVDIGRFCDRYRDLITKYAQ